jgi:tetratricopeptide (TPR) repeat protein
MTVVAANLQYAVDQFRAGRLREAAATCRAILALRPELAEAHNLLGTIHKSLAQPAEARACFERAIACDPAHFDALVNLGCAVAETGRFDEATGYFERAVSLRPDSAPAHLLSGDVRSHQGDWAAAVECYRKALALDDRLATAHCHWGMVLQAQREFAAAIEHYRLALERAPDDVETLLNLGTTLAFCGDTDAAVAQYERVLKIDPTHQRALADQSAICQQRDQVPRAIACYDRALEKSPGEPTLHLERGYLHWLAGDLPAAWVDFEWRRKIPGFPLREFEIPAWDGGEIAGKTLLVHAEQGLGDTLQFVRYVPIVRPLCGRVVILAQPRLANLLRQSGFEYVVTDSGALAGVDYQVPMMSLPYLVGTTLRSIPADVPYLFASPELVDAWRDRLKDLRGFRVGISWKGNPENRFDRQRSAPLAAFEALARVAGVRLISLQKHDGLDQLQGLAGRFEVHRLGDDWDEAAGPFMDTAAVIKNLDLVVSVDSAIVHLAGALGVPTWVALAARADCRWMRQRDDSPWYPSVRLFRQPRMYDWPDLFEQMARELDKRLKSRSAP